MQQNACINLTLPPKIQGMSKKSIPLLSWGILLGMLWPSVSAQAKTPNYQACGLKVRFDRARDMRQWKPLIAAYSQRHYGENTWKLRPRAIVQHYTVSQGFPWNLVRSPSFANETPGLGTQYVVDGSEIWEVIPPDVRARAAYGINHRAISIEMVAMNAQDLYENKQATLRTSAELTLCLMKTYRIPLRSIYSHQEVGSMDRRKVPYVKDLIDPKPYPKIDPGPQNMTYIRDWLRRHYHPYR